MSTTTYIPGENVRRAVTPEQFEVTNKIPQGLGTAVFEEIMNPPVDIDPQAEYEARREQVPIFKLQAVEEARKLTQQFKDTANYEELVKYVQKWREIICGENDTEMDHKAIAVLLADQIMFSELMRSHEELDNAHEYLTKEPNAWAKHEAMYKELQEAKRNAAEKCEEAKQLLNRLM